MNPVEIEEQLSALAAAPFDPVEFPYAFLAAFGTKETAIKRLRVGGNNLSDIPGGVLLRNNIHIATCAEGAVSATLKALLASPKTKSTKAKFVLATDGVDFEAEEIGSGNLAGNPFEKLADDFGFFLPLAGISTVREITNNPVDIKATGRLNKLYIEILKENPDWGTDKRRQELNQFMARLIFCFFAEDTGIFAADQFTKALADLTDVTSSNTHEVISELFRAMDIEREKRGPAKLKTWAEKFPYVNGGLFKGSTECPRFSRIARAYLLRAGDLDWSKINPDIFGSMIQAVEDEDERGSLGMHYTSVPNILKVLNPLFLDSLREQLEAAGNSAQKLRNLWKRITSIRVFDPACGSGNFLVIAYQQMREIEAEIIKRLKVEDTATRIKLESFYGIEIKSFPVEIAKLSLLIAEFQCDVRYRGERLACLNVLPLHRTGQVVVGNALRMDWIEVCPPLPRESKGPHDQNASEERNDLGKPDDYDTYVCGNPPYLGGKGQSIEQKKDLSLVFSGERNIGELDYVSGWFLKACKYIIVGRSTAAFVATNSINQGAQVQQLWLRIFSMGISIQFAHTSFPWANSAKANAGVICNIVGLGNEQGGQRKLYDGNTVRSVSMIGPYLIPENDIIIRQSLSPIAALPPIITGNSPYDGGNLLLSSDDKRELTARFPEANRYIRRLYGSVDFINGQERYCLWIADADARTAAQIEPIGARIQLTKKSREVGGDVARKLTHCPHKFRYTHTAKKSLIIVPRVSSERREYIPAGVLPASCVISDAAQAVYDGDTWVFALIVSRIHVCWVKAIAGRLTERIRYSSALCYNTFPVPVMTEKNKADLTRCAEDILLAREAHFPATIADLYDPETMPDDLRRAHERNDETLERIYIGRRFRNDTERLEKLFDLYTKMTAAEAAKEPKAKAAKKTKANS